MIIKNEQLDKALQMICNRKLAEALDTVENYLYTYSYPRELEKMQSIKEDYRLMTDYWKRGYKDPQLHELYQRLLQRLYVVTANLAINYCISNASFHLGTYKRSRAAREDWSLTAIRQEMENYVSEMAMTDLLEPSQRTAKRQQLNETHYRMMRDLFDYIWTSKMWSERVADAFTDLLLTPTIDSRDQQLMVSAVMLSMLNAFDMQKLKVLMSVYSQSANERVRQRALVAWAITFDSNMATLYPEMADLLTKVTADERCCQELKELQMQIIYCLNTDEDSRRIQKEMIPELLKNNDQFRLTRNGIEEIEEDSLEDILHPEASEQRMEKLEATMNKMIDMQRAGSDIYFGGFSQMKRFPFFDSMCNWFMPFYAEHPAIRQALGDERRSRLLLALMKRTPFCDSDSYSFALGFHSAMNQLPQSFIDMLDRGEMSLLGEQMDESSANDPAFIRRSYLQDLYRFYRLFPSRSSFDNPFETTTHRSRLFFYQQQLFQQTPMVNDNVEVAAFMAKKKLYKEALKVLSNCNEQQRDERYYMTYATTVQHLHMTPLDGQLAIDCYQQVLKRSPQNEAALKGIARAMFQEKDYQGACNAYEQLLILHPDDPRYLLNKAVCMGNMKQYDEALKILFKLNYEDPDNNNVKRILAWTLVGSGKTEQAGKIYTQMLDTVQPEGDDLLNYGICQWLQGDILGAIGLFHRYEEACGKENFNPERVFCQDEAELLHNGGIDDDGIRMMLDAIKG